MRALQTSQTSWKVKKRPNNLLACSFSRLENNHQDNFLIISSCSEISTRFIS